MEKHLVDMTQMSQMLSVSLNTLRNDILKREDFPKPVSIGPRTKRWKVSDVMEWVDYLKDTQSN